jgi:rare lipoprotein A
MMPVRLLLFSPYLLLILLLASCSAPSVHVPVLVPPGEESKSIPPQSKVPPTQRPYRIGGHTYYPLPTSHGYRATGVASWYGGEFHGRRTSNGETYNMHAETAAHKTLPMNTFVLVRNLENGRETVVRINDRGPFAKGRIIDLSFTAAKKLDIVGCGTARVEVVALAEAVAYQRGGRTYERFLPFEDPNRGEFFVQVGAFSDRQNAVRLKERLLAMERKSVIQVYTDGPATFYRVQVRAGQDLIVAGRVEKVLEDMGFPGAFVVAR